MVVYLNGRWIDAEQATISADDRGLLYADGVFETARLFDGGYFRFAAHYRRFAAGAAALRLPVPDEARLRGIADEVAIRNGLSEGTFRVTLTRGREAGGEPTLLATLRPMATDWREQAARGWRLVTARIRHPSAAAIPPHIKSLGRLHGLLARFEAADARADDALLLTPDGLVCEGPTWNVFWRVGETLFTPSLDAGVLDGVTRATVLELARAEGMHVIEGTWPRAALDDADEIFATMSSLGCVRVRGLDNRALDPAAATAASVLSQLYWDAVAREVREPAGGTDRASGTGRSR